MEPRYKNLARSRKSGSGWRPAGWTVLLLGAGAAICHLLAFPWLIAGVEHPSIYRWFVAVSPLLLAALGAGSVIHSVNDWLASSVAGVLVLEIVDLVAVRGGSASFPGRAISADPGSAGGTPFLGRMVGVACLLALAAAGIELLRAVNRWRSERSTPE